MAAGIAEPASLTPLRGERSGCADFRTLRFGALPASAHEAEQVARAWKRRHGGEDGDAIALTGPAATEGAFKAVAPGCRVLHVATHAFFVGERCEGGHDGDDGLRGMSVQRVSSSSGGNSVEDEAPWRLSGLALAGAKSRESASPEGEDGVLTSEEVASLDLSGVEWAVLSACDAVGGLAPAGEGVVGLQHAFAVAGVATVIQSLWSVRDRAAQQWMKALYAARFERGLPTAEAVREASPSMLRARRATGGSTHPFTWGAFVAVGGGQ